ncbi:MAG TPA: PAS domain-containing protein [Methylorubrum populi]|uniref:Blue-light-activated histidine kinase n=1 Tax=Methylorubrum populi TaxID=223967 RepID=A0A921JDJ8_9HYPH|nr:PAS domain-containing protein [Methylorubrum populi]
MAGCIRAFDWASTPLGPIAGWPQSLKTIIDLMLVSPSMMSLVWGPEAIHLYNDSFTELLREHRTLALGQSAFETFARSRGVFADDLAAGMAGRSARLIGQQYPVLRNGRLEEAWFDVEYAPVHNDDGCVAGVLWTLKETTAQHLLESALRESEARHRLLIESCTQAVWETDAAGVVVTDSPSWRAHTGQTLEEWLGYGWLNGIHPDDRAYAEKQWREAVAARGLVNAEFRLRAPDGGWRWTNVRAAPVLDGRGKIEKWAGMNIDIDARKRAEAALRESDARLAQLADAVPVLIWETGYEGATFVNSHYLAYFGVSYDGIAGFNWTRFVHPDDVNGYIAAYEQAFAEGRPYDYECRLLRADGQYRWHHTSGRPASHGRFIGSCTDIHDLVAAERALREREERQAFLLKLSDALRPLTDLADIQGEITRLLREQLNAGWCYYVDWDLDREIGLVLRDSVIEGLPSLAGAHDVSDAPKFLQLLAVGAVLTVRDYASYEQLPTRIRQKFVALGFRSMMAAPLVKEGRLIASLLVGNTEIRDWSASEASLLVEVAERAWAAIERGRAERALRESEERFQQFATASAAGLWIRDAEALAMEFVSPAVATIYGVEPNTLFGDVTRWAALIVPDDRDVALAHLEAARRGKTVVHEFRIQRPSDGAIRWIRNTDFPLRDNSHILRVGGIAEDVTEAKRASERLEVLVNELQHRSRNLLGVITAVAGRTLRQGGSVDAFDERLQALSRAQGLLSQYGSDTVEVGALVRAELAAHTQERSKRVQIAGPEVQLTAPQVQNFALALHELTTNAVKYGALKDGTGSLIVTWEVIRYRSEHRRLALNWAESGVPIDPSKVTRQGYGTELIQGALAYALEANVEYALGADGVRCRIEMPIEQPE